MDYRIHFWGILLSFLPIFLCYFVSECCLYHCSDIFHIFLCIFSTGKCEVIDLGKLHVQTCKTTQPRSLISTFVICFSESSIPKLATKEISMFYLVSVAEQAGLNKTLCWKPWRQVLL